MKLNYCQNTEYLPGNYMVSYSVLLGNYQEGKYNEIMPKILGIYLLTIW